MTQPARLSPAGLRFIETHEGFRPRLYNDAAGHATIGYGHLVHRGRVGTNTTAENPFVAGIGRAPAAILLARDVGGAEAAVRTWAYRPLQQHEFDALVSFTFNVGAGALKNSTLIRRVNTNATPDAIASAFLMWTKAAGQELPGLVRRRRDEANLFNTGSYGGPVP